VLWIDIHHAYHRSVPQFLIGQPLEHPENQDTLYDTVEGGHTDLPDVGSRQRVGKPADERQRALLADHEFPIEPFNHEGQFIRPALAEFKTHVDCVLL
jgi:hypothetical protein